MEIVSTHLPLLITLFPLVGAAAVALAARSGAKIRGWAANLVSFGTLLLSVRQLYLVSAGRVLTYELNWYPGFGLKWQADYLSAVLAVITALIWLLTNLFSLEYMAGEHEQTRFYICFVFTLGPVLGVFLAGDLLSLFPFFVLLAFSSYLLIVHSETADALEAGNTYLLLSALGWLCLLGLIVFMQRGAGHSKFQPLLDQLLARGPKLLWLFLAAAVGFGVQAAVVPLQIWLPKADPVAPAPVSALLCGLMIKTGVYGMLRIFMQVYSASETGSFFFAQINLGYALTWLGTLTMLGGALSALVQIPLKRVLAYSSISQIGYILFALGTAVLLGSSGAWGLAGAWLHLINHAFFKSFLFLISGAVYLQTKNLDLDKLGGLRRQMPAAFAFFLLAAGAITGIPGLNGFLSKVLIHEAILHAYELKGWGSLLWMERAFVLTGGLTAAYITKIWLRIFCGAPRRDWSAVKDLSRAQKGIFAVYGGILLTLGLAAAGSLKYLVLPVLELFSFNSSHLEQIKEVAFWSPPQLSGPLVSYLIAAAVLLLLHLLGPRLQVPPWLSMEALIYRPLVRWAKKIRSGR